ncbi:MAG: hypothetical protein ABW116_08905 [Candidatus Sedimenticola sp. 20ELBAFRAG]
MKKLYLHIGTGKTGSTSIQETFSSLGRDGLYFRSWKKATVFINNVDDILGELSRVDDRLIVLSSEWLFRAKEGFIRKLGSKLNDLFDVNIIIYLRRQDEFAVSAYQQNTKRFDGKGVRGSVSLPEGFGNGIMDYNDICLRWAEVFGREKMNIRVFSQEDLLKGCVINDFARVIGVPLDGSIIKNRNQSVGKISFKLAHIIKDYHVSRELYRKIVFDAPESEKALPDRETAERFYHRHVASNRKLKREFNIHPEREELFSNDFSKYPLHRTDQWDEESANRALIHLCEVLLQERTRERGGMQEKPRQTLSVVKRAICSLKIRVPTIFIRLSSSMRRRLP